MKNQPGYFVGPFEPGKPLSGIVIALVKASAAPDVAEGDVVVGFLPWQQLQLAPRAAVTVVPDSKALLTDLKAPASLLLGAMGMVRHVCVHVWVCQLE
jgi:NADPH-dependent curcumin reductase CurA